jgi:hypothetical protein
MASSYQDRVSVDAFKDDVECEVRLEPNPKDDSTTGSNAWIPERLLARLRCLGLAYELPLLSRLPSNGQTSYPEVQLAVLEDELVFLFEVVSDEALLRATLPVRDLIGRAKQDPRGWSLVVETQ